MLWQKYYGLYIQDDWQITDKLTLNLGLRYEYLTPYAEKHGQVGWIDFDGIEPITGEKGVFKFIEPNGYQSDPNKKGFAPRVGLAYRLDEKTVVRAAGAIFFAANNGINAASSDFGNGTFVLNSLSLGEPNVLPFTPPAGGDLANPFAGGLSHPDRSTTFAGENVRADRRDHPYATLYNWNFNVQRMINPELMVEVGYVGSHLIHSFWNRHHNANWPGHMELGNDLQTRVENPYFGKIQTGPLSFPTVLRRQLLLPYPQYRQVLLFRDPYGSGSYHSMIARLEKRYSNGLSLLGSYTGSKSILTTPESNSWLVGPSNAIWDPSFNKSLDVNDTPHRFVLSYLYEVPFRGSGPLKWVLGDWQVSGIHVFQTGRPAAITAPDTTGLQQFRYTHGRADRLNDGALSGSAQSKEKWFDTSAFATAAPYTLPTDSLTQSSIRTPGRASFDFSMSKNIPIKEAMRMQFRAEFYNITNTPMFELRGASTEVSSRQFGQIIEGAGQRNIQLALRFIF